MAAPAPPSPAAVSLADQADELEKITRERERFWPEQVARGRLKPETAESKIAAVRAAALTLRWLARNDGWIKAEAERRRLLRMEEAQERARIVAEREARGLPDPPPDDNAARDDPMTRAMLEHFPDAELGDVRPLYTPDPDQHPEPHEEAA